MSRHKAPELDPDTAWVYSKGGMILNPIDEY
jgi:hypothetical protein